MGDRGNIVILQRSESGRAAPPLYLYSHRHGYLLPAILRDVLALRQCWRDEPYLARLIFCTMVGDRQTTLHERTTGFGIGTTLADSNNPLLVIDAKAQEVLVVHERAYDSGHLRLMPDVIAARYSFEAYVALPIDADGLNGWAVVTRWRDLAASAR